MTLPAPDAVIFDMDGTIVRHKNKAVLITVEILDNFSFFLSAILKPFCHNKIIPDHLLDHDDHKKSPSLFWHKVMHKLRRKPIDHIIELCPHVEDVFKYFHEKNIPMAIVSNGLGEGYGHTILEVFDIEKYFKAQVFKEDIKKSKPHPEPLLLALKRLGMDDNKEHVIWYIGDRPKDAMAARAADGRSGVVFIPIAYGKYTSRLFAKERYADIPLINDYKDLISL